MDYIHLLNALTVSADLCKYFLCPLGIEKGQLMEEAISLSSSPQPCHCRLVRYRRQENIKVIFEGIYVL